ncbi:MAG: ABC transporter permease subunit, partial [Planctomycetota bacterium]
MSSFVSLLQVAAVLTVAFLFTTRAIPRLVVAVGRALGFRMKPTPVTAKRLARFRRIRRGYYSFLIISTLFVASLFLELLVNSKPLAIHYGERTAFPAVAEWLDGVVFFAEINSFLRKTDFGQVGKGEVDYNAFAATVDDPSLLVAERDALAEELAAKRAKLGPPPPESARRGKKLRYKRKLKKLKKLEERLAALDEAAKVFESGDAWVLMPIYPYAPDDLRYDLPTNPPNKPIGPQRHDVVVRADGRRIEGTIISQNETEVRIRPLDAEEALTLSLAGEEGAKTRVIRRHHSALLGTDTSGRDVVPLLLYGFRISMAFALVVAFLGYCIGICVGAVQGYYGGWTDIITQRLQEIWGSIPFLFTIMIIASVVRPSFFLLAFLLVALRSWLGITFYIRGEFYREKSKDYVQAAIGHGVSDVTIMLRHILPNSLVPV